MVELCAGSAILTYYLLGFTGHQITPYQGGKWGLRKKLAPRIVAAGFKGPPSVVELSDLSYWGTAHQHILCPKRRKRIIARLRQLGKMDPREVYDSLHKHKMNFVPEWATAEFLFLQRLAWSAKAVGTADGRWKAQGFNTTSALGLPGTDQFGEVKPLIPALIRRLEALKLPPFEHRIRRGPARPPNGFQWRTVAYIDPPYCNTTSYPDGHMGRAEVVDLALAWQAAGAFVMVSEGEAVEELTRRGWTAEQLKKPKPKETAQFVGKQGEWLTCSR